MTFGTQVGENACIFQGDCFDWLYLIGQVDHVITDPPYESHMHKPRRKGIRSDGGSQGVTDLGFDAIDDTTRSQIALEAAQRAQGWALIFCTAEGVAAWRDALEGAGARYKRAMPWVKTDPTPQFNGQGPAHCLEMIVGAWCGPGYSRWNGGGKGGEFRGPTKAPGRTGLHKTEKPIWLMASLIADFTGSGDTILDPMMGSGTTGVAALRLGRKFIGIEAQPGAFRLAHKRLSEVEQQPDLFRPRPKMKQARLPLAARAENLSTDDREIQN